VAPDADGPSRPLPLLAPPSCSNPVRGGLTDREVRLLREMRRLKEALREAPPSVRQELLARLDLLKGEREEARRERMALLGHEA